MASGSVKTAILPVGGLGSRFLPATKAMPKEMLTVVDKPLVQYGVEEAIEAGMTTCALVTGRGKRAIADHFDISYELEQETGQRGTVRCRAEVLLEEERRVIAGLGTGLLMRLSMLLKKMGRKTSSSRITGLMLSGTDPALTLLRMCN